MSRFPLYRVGQLVSNRYNWVTNFGRGEIQTRFVQKLPSYFNANLSSHIQSANSVNIAEYEEQFKLVLRHYNQTKSKPAEQVNINFTTRGEPLANKFLVNEWNRLHDRLYWQANSCNLRAKMNISTVMPHAIARRDLCEVFDKRPANIYYSLYSIDPDFRSIWIPDAMDWNAALDKLHDYHEFCRNEGRGSVTFRWAFIKGQKDQNEQADRVAEVLAKKDFSGAKFNIVPFDRYPRRSEEKPAQENLEHCCRVFQEVLGNPLSEEDIFEN